MQPILRWHWVAAALLTVGGGWAAAAEIPVDSDQSDLIRGVDDTVRFSNLPITVSAINGVAPTDGLLPGWAWSQDGFLQVNGGAVTVAPKQTDFALVDANTVYHNTSNTTLMTGDTTVWAMQTQADFHLQAGTTLTLDGGGLMWSGGNHWVRAPTAGMGGGPGGSITSGLASGELFLIANGTADNYQLNAVAITDNNGTAVRVVKGGPGLISLNGAQHTYTGGTVINSGTLRIMSHDALPSGGHVEVRDGAQFWIQGSTNSTVEVVGTGTGDNYGAIRITSGALSGAVSLLGDTTIGLNGGTISGGISLGVAGSHTLTLGTPVANGAGTFSGAISNGAGVLNLTVAHGTATLSGAAKTFTGAINVVDGGQLNIDSAVHNAASIYVGPGGTLHFFGANRLTSGHSVAKSAAFLATIDGGTWTNNAGAVNRVGNVDLLNGATWTLTQANADWGTYYLGALTDGAEATVTVGGTSASTIDGNGNLKLGTNTVFDVSNVTGDAAADLIVDVVLDNQTNNQLVDGVQAAGGFTKTGAGTMLLTAANIYSGATTVNAGTLLVNNLSGSGTGSGQVTVGADATLGGTGTIGGDVVVLSSGVLAPGESIGALAINGDLTLSGVLEIEYDNTSIDQLHVGGLLDISNGTLDLIDLASWNPAVGDALVFASYGSLNGEFQNVLNLPSLTAIIYGYQGNNIALMAIPEPSTYTLGAIGLAISGWLTWRRRFARRS